MGGERGKRDRGRLDSTGVMKVGVYQANYDES